jgi:hypothetical protein
MFITWQLVLTSVVGHRQANVQKHECVQTLNTMRWEISPFTLKIHKCMYNV